MRKSLSGNRASRSQIFSEDVVLAVAYPGVEGAFALDVNRQRPVVRESPLCRICFIPNLAVDPPVNKFDF
jgi:hypothetical protein